MPSITIFDGSATIGGSKIYLEDRGCGIILDFGINYRKMYDFYEEFLAPRSARGIHDLLHMRLIPQIANYRRDLIPEDMDLSKYPKLNIQAVFISHAHLDHAGHISLLDLDIPAIATPTTAAILKAMNDCGTGFNVEAAYTVPREASKDDARVLSTPHWKSGSYVGRSFFLAGDIEDSLNEFWQKCPNSRGLNAGELRSLDELGGIRVWEVDHSIYGASACAIETSSGWVVYTGDIRAHGIFKDKTEKFIDEAKALSPQVLIIEGTRVGVDEPHISEHEVYENCLEATLEEKDLIVADFSPRNFERLDTFARIARESGREIVVLAKDAYLLDALKCAQCIDRMEELFIYKDLKARRDAYEKIVHQKYEGKLVDPTDIASSPERYILCFSFWDIKHLLDIKPREGLYIYSSSEAYTEDQIIDFIRLNNWLERFNFKVRGFKIVEKNGKPIPEFERGFHASGHASSEEIIEIAEEIKPEIVIPVHTESPDIFKEKLGKVRVSTLRDGETLTF